MDQMQVCMGAWAHGRVHAWTYATELLILTACGSWSDSILYIYIHTTNYLRYTMYYIRYTAYYMIYNIYYILYNIYYILYTIYHILYTIYYILYAIYYTLCTIYSEICIPVVWDVAGLK